MKSINGFNNSSLQGSSNISQINRIGAGVDIAKTAMSNDVQFQTSTGGTSYSIPNQVYQGVGEYKQFDCFVQRWQDPNNPDAAPEYRLRCVRGLTSFDNYNVDEQGFVKNEQFVYNHRLSKWNAYPTGTFEYDPDDASEIFLDDGYIKLTKNKNYKVFLWKINPTIDAWPESKSAQIAVIEEGIAADTNVMPKYNGGGSMQAYIVSSSTTIDNIVTANPLNGSIANFDAADLNGYVTFHAEELLVTDNNDGSANNFPASMQSWLAGQVPVFAKPSTNPDEEEPDGMSINHVPYDVVGFIGYAYPPSAPYIDYANGDGSTSFTSDNIVKAWDVGTRYGYTQNPFVSGLILPEDAFRIRIQDVPAHEVVEFEATDIDIIANSQTSVTSTTLEMVTGKPVGNIGFKEFDCARKEIAYIKWVSDDPEHPELTGKFDIYQINNGPINFTYKPILIDFVKVPTQGDAHWGINNDAWVSPDVVEIGLYWNGSGAYEDDLTSSKYKENSNNIGGFLPGSPTRSSG
jgi:hypothetical protein